MLINYDEIEKPKSIPEEQRSYLLTHLKLKGMQQSNTKTKVISKLKVMSARHLTQPNYRYNDGKMAFYYMEKSRALKFTHLPLPTTAIPVEAGGGQG